MKVLFWRVGKKEELHPFEFENVVRIKYNFDTDHGFNANIYVKGDPKPYIVSFTDLYDVEIVEEI